MRTYNLTRSQVRRSKIRTRSGSIEYAETGFGDVVLVLHGGGGGWDLGIVLGHHFVSGYRVVAPSRPGYLGTALAVGQTFEDQAHAMISLLDALEIPTAALFARSAGGPIGALIAALYPDRIWALIADSAVFLPYQTVFKTPRHPILATLKQGFNLWRMWQQPRPFIRRTLARIGHFDEEGLDRAVAAIEADCHQLRFFLRLNRATFPQNRRRLGRMNDLKQLKHLKSLPLESIQVPTLICHGRLDADVPIAHAQYAAGCIPGAELFVLENGIHLLALSKDWRMLHDRQRAFLARHCSGGPNDVEDSSED